MFVLLWTVVRILSRLWSLPQKAAVRLEKRCRKREVFEMKEVINLEGLRVRIRKRSQHVEEMATV